MIKVIGRCRGRKFLFGVFSLLFPCYLTDCKNLSTQGYLISSKIRTPTSYLGFQSKVLAEINTKLYINLMETAYSSQS